MQLILTEEMVVRVRLFDFQSRNVYIKIGAANFVKKKHTAPEIVG